MSLEALTEISRFYGSNPDFVLAGGGNTSWKDDGTLYVKGSGMPLADVSPESFVQMNRDALAKIWEKQYPESSGAREKEVLSDMMAARKPGEEQKRPSVEALLHDILPFPLVVHLHPALVNGLACSKQGELAMKAIFGNEAVWIPSINPGYILSKAVKSAMEDYCAACGKMPSIIFLQNHGVFTGGATENGIKKIYDTIISKIDARIKRRPDFSDEKREPVNCDAQDGGIGSTLAKLSGSNIALMQGKEISALVQNREAFNPASSAFTPDHIVYSGSDPLFIADSRASCIAESWADHVQKTGRNPKIAAVRGLGVYGMGASEKAASLALDLFKDTVKIAIYSESFGGPLHMSRDKIDFINNWEVERFRAGVSARSMA